MANVQIIYNKQCPNDKKSRGETNSSAPIEIIVQEERINLAISHPSA